jgi:hypothetical protein
MKKILLAVLVICIIAGAAFLIKKREAVAPAPAPVSGGSAGAGPVELCFGMFTPPNERGFSDKYTLRMLLDNAKGAVTGELDFVPGEKDSKTGAFAGTVTPVDKVMMARTIDATWHTSGEGIKAEEPLKIIFGEGTASIPGFGLDLTDVACSELTLRDNVEAYLRAHISALSPVPAVLGGTWYVIGVSTDPGKHSGVVVYEDGHIQEKKNFTFTADEKGSVTSASIE